MLTINERRVGEAIILDLEGTLLIPDDDAALLEVVSRCASNGGRLVVLDIAGLARIDAAGLGALIRSQNLLVSRGGELRLANPSKLVGAILHRTRLDSVIPTFSVEPGNQELSGGHGAVRTSAAAQAKDPWWGALWSDETEAGASG